MNQQSKDTVSFKGFWNNLVEVWEDISGAQPNKLTAETMEFFNQAKTLAYQNGGMISHKNNTEEMTFKLEPNGNATFKCVDKKNMVGDVWATITPDGKIVDSDQGPNNFMWVDDFEYDYFINLKLPRLVNRVKANVKSQNVHQFENSVYPYDYRSQLSPEAQSAFRMAKEHLEKWGFAESRVGSNYVAMCNLNDDNSVTLSAYHVKNNKGYFATVKDGMLISMSDNLGNLDSNVRNKFFVDILNGLRVTSN